MFLLWFWWSLSRYAKPKHTVLSAERTDKHACNWNNCKWKDEFVYRQRYVQGVCCSFTDLFDGCFFSHSQSTYGIRFQLKCLLAAAAAAWQPAALWFDSDGNLKPVLLPHYDVHSFSKMLKRRTSHTHTNTEIGPIFYEWIRRQWVVCKSLCMWCMLFA